MWNTAVRGKAERADMGSASLDFRVPRDHAWSELFRTVERGVLESFEKDMNSEVQYYVCTLPWMFSWES